MILTSTDRPTPRLRYPLARTPLGTLATIDDDRAAIAQVLALVVDHGRGDLGPPGLRDPLDDRGGVRDDGRPRLAVLAQAVVAMLQAAGWPGVRVTVESERREGTRFGVLSLQLRGEGSEPPLRLDVRATRGGEGLRMVPASERRAKSPVR